MYHKNGICKLITPAFGGTIRASRRPCFGVEMGRVRAKIRVVCMGAFGKNIPKEVIRLFPAGLSKKEVLEGMMEAIAATGVVKDRQAFLRALFEREAIRSTGFKGIAIPHVRIDEITEPTVGVGVSRAGINFDALDSAPVNIVVLFAMPSGSDKEYLGYLAQVMLSLRTAGFTQKLLACETPEDIARVIEQGP